MVKRLLAVLLVLLLLGNLAACGTRETEADENHLLAFEYDENKTLSEIASPEEGAELEEILHKFDEENF